MTDHQEPTNYRGFSIEHERNGTFSIFSASGYMQGNFETAEAAKRFLDDHWFGFPEAH